MPDVSCAQQICPTFLPLHFLTTDSLTLVSSSDPFLHALTQLPSHLGPTHLRLLSLSTRQLAEIARKLELNAVSRITRLTIEGCVLDLESVCVVAALLFPKLATNLTSFTLVGCEWKYPSSLKTALSVVHTHGIDGQVSVDAMRKLDALWYDGKEMSGYARNHMDMFRGGQTLLVSLFRNCPHLKKICINDPSMAALWRPFGVKERISCFSSMLLSFSKRKITHIDLAASGLFDPHLGAGLAGFLSLESISLADNFISDAGVGVLLGNLESVSSVSKIDLSDNQIAFQNDNIWNRLLSVLDTNPQLTLVLTGNPIARDIDHPRIRFEHGPESSEEEYVVVSPPTNWENFMQEEEEDDEDDSEFEETGGSSSGDSATSGLVSE